MAEREKLNFHTSNQDLWPTYKNDKAYSPIFIDLIDEYNQMTSKGSNFPNDQVSGYTMYKLNQILKKTYGLSSLKANLKSSDKPTGVSDTKIDLLFKKYEEIWK